MLGALGGQVNESDSPADLHRRANLRPAPERVSTSQKLCTIRESTEGAQPSHEEDIGICRRVSARVHFRSPLPPLDGRRDRPCPHIGARDWIEGKKRKAGQMYRCSNSRLAREYAAERDDPKINCFAMLPLASCDLAILFPRWSVKAARDHFFDLLHWERPSSMSSAL